MCWQKWPHGTDLRLWVVLGLSGEDDARPCSAARSPPSPSIYASRVHAMLRFDPLMNPVITDYLDWQQNIWAPFYKETSKSSYFGEGLQIWNPFDLELLDAAWMMELGLDAVD